MKAKPIPDGYHTATPYLIIKGAGEAIAFYQRVFGATERMRLQGPDGKIGHAEITIGNSPIMLADEVPAMGHLGPEQSGSPGMFLMLYVEDVDGTTKKAIEAGAKVVRPVENQFYGDRSGTVRDPFGYMWTIATHIEDVAPDEMERRIAKFKQAGC